MFVFGFRKLINNLVTVFAVLRAPLQLNHYKMAFQRSIFTLKTVDSIKLLHYSFKNEKESFGGVAVHLHHQPVQFKSREVTSCLIKLELLFGSLTMSPSLGSKILPKLRSLKLLT